MEMTLSFITLVETCNENCKVSAKEMRNAAITHLLRYLTTL